MPCDGSVADDKGRRTTERNGTGAIGHDRLISIAIGLEKSINNRCLLFKKKTNPFEVMVT